MLRKFIRIRNVGRFRNHNAVNDQTLRDFNIIWGANSAGKTTLASIVDSLRSDEPEIIIGRKTIGSSDPQDIQILTDEATKHFANGKWDDSYPTAEVYYPGFVSRTVFAADAVTVDHKRALCDFALGREAVASKKQLTDVVQQEKAAETQLGRSRKLLEKSIIGEMTVDEFIKLQAEPDVDIKLEAANGDYKQALNTRAILSLPVPTPPPVPVQLGKEFDNLAAASLKDVDAQAVAHVRDHIAERLGPEGEEWLRYGTEALHDTESCPYCNQSTKGLDLVDAYRRFFSSEYGAFVSSLDADLQDLSQRVSANSFDSMVLEIEHARAQALTYAEYCGLDREALSDSLDESRKEWKEAVAVLQRLIANKRQNPLSVLEITQDERDAIARANRALDQLATAIQHVADVSAPIALYREKLSGSNPDDLRRNVERLQNLKLRQTEAMRDEATTYQHLVAEKERLTREKARLRASIDAKMAEIVPRLKDDINYYLARFGTNVKIEGATVSYIGREASIDYKLVVQGVAIGTAPTNGVPTVPCIANVLGDGDKSALGLAFFLARLKNRDSVEGLTVYVDDPVNSMDHTRLTQTVQELFNLRERGAQIIASTHNPAFARALVRHPLAAGALTLRITAHDGSQCLRPWDPTDTLSETYFANFNALADFADSGVGDPGTVVRLIRPFAEDYIRYRFPGRFGPQHWLGDMLQAISSADDDDALAALKSQYDDLDAANIFSAPYMHGGTAGSSAPDEPALELHVKNVLRLAGWTPSDV